MNASWNAIADRSLSARIEEHTERIASSILAVPLNEQSAPDLAGGLPGVALFMASHAQLTGRKSCAEYARQCVDASLDAIARLPMSVGLYVGIPGAVWAADLILHMLGDQADGETVAPEFDDLLAQYVGREQWSGHFDLISGLAGIGIYALERAPERTDSGLLQAVIHHLDQLAVRSDRGITWRTRPEHIGVQSGPYNLGIAHGIPGVIAVLAEMWRRGHRDALVRDMLEQSVRWLISYRRDVNMPSAFAYTAGESIGARLAWCYGDAGIYAALIRANDTALPLNLPMEDLRQQLIRREWGSTGIVSGGLCHGSAGLAHIYNAAFQATGDEAMRDLSFAALDRTLAMLEMKEPAHEEMSGPGYLTGTAGIGLTLQAAISGTPPRWDTPLMISINVPGVAG